MQVRFRFRPPSRSLPFRHRQFRPRHFHPRALWRARVALDRSRRRCVVGPVRRRRWACLAAQFRRLDPLLMRVHGRADVVSRHPARARSHRRARTAHGKRDHRAHRRLCPGGRALVRASALVVRELDYVDAARIAGASNARIMLRHILPNSVSPLLVHVTFRPPDLRPSG